MCLQRSREKLFGFPRKEKRPLTTMKLRPRNPDYYYGGDNDDAEEHMTKKAASVAMNLMLMAPPSNSTGHEVTFPGHAAPAAELLLDFNFSNNNTTNGADFNMHFMGGREEYETNENHHLNLQLFHNHLGHEIPASNLADGVQGQPLFPQNLQIKPPQAVKGKKAKASRLKKPVKMCPHGKRKQFCVPCDGSQICVHKRFCCCCCWETNNHLSSKSNQLHVSIYRRKSKCKECGGSEICIHNRRVSVFCKRDPSVFFKSHSFVPLLNVENPVS